MPCCGAGPYFDRRRYFISIICPDLSTYDRSAIILPDKVNWHFFPLTEPEQ